MRRQSFGRRPRYRRPALAIAIVLLATAALAAGLWPLPAAKNSVGPLYAGAPVAVAAAGPVRRLDNPGFAVGYSPARGTSLWVAYRAEPVAWSGFHERPAFSPDTRVTRSPAPGSYRGSGYDRGHMAPNYLIANLYGAAAQKASFLLSNVAPQRPRLNQLLWQRLEEIEVDHLAVWHEALWVTLGPIYGRRPERLGGMDGVDVPEAYYRIWLDLDYGRPRVLALRVPQNVRGDERLNDFVVSVDAVEAETGLDFFPDLAKDVQARLEGEPGDADAWGLTGLACFPARYNDNWQGRNGIRLNYGQC
jgi:endonuclease G